MKRISLLIGVCLVISAAGAFAQRAGQMSTVRYGTVVNMQTVDLNDASAVRGALVGGAFGAALTKSSKSTSRRQRNTAIGALVGSASAASQRTMGRRYSVSSNDGTVFEIVTEQTEIRIDDCVIVEESGGKANIRRTAQTACDAASQAVMNDPDVRAEAEEDAAECAAAKEQLISAESDEQMDFAVRKIKVLCYN